MGLLPRQRFLIFSPDSSDSIFLVHLSAFFF
jgi:hypothetical protein